MRGTAFAEPNAKGRKSRKSRKSRKARRHSQKRMAAVHEEQASESPQGSGASGSNPTSNLKSTVKPHGKRVLTQGVRPEFEGNNCLRLTPEGGVKIGKNANDAGREGKTYPGQIRISVGSNGVMINGRILGVNTLEDLANMPLPDRFSPLGIEPHP